jgi:tetratricopeptide (TPR) repeat protein
MTTKKNYCGLKDLGKRCETASLLGLSILLLAYQLPKASLSPPSEPVGEERVSISATTVPTTLVPTPIPVAQPAEHLKMARIHQRNGDYQSAIAAYKAVLTNGSLRLAQDGASQEQIREAWYHLGESYLASGSYKLAVDTLKDFLREHRGSDKRYPQTFFLLARAYQGLGDWAEAIVHYRAYLARRDVIASYVNELIGDCYINLVSYSEAINAYEDALREAPVAGLQVHIREKIADAHLRQQNYEPAIAQYDAILKIARIGYYRAKIEYLAGMAHLNWGQTAQAHARFLEAVDNYPTVRYAYLSLVELVNAGVKVDDFQRGLVDYHNGAYRPAIDAFYRYIQADPHAHSGAAHYYAGLAYKAIESYELARREFDLLIDTHASSTSLLTPTLRASAGTRHGWRKPMSWLTSESTMERYRSIKPLSGSIHSMLWPERSSGVELIWRSRAIGMTKQPGPRSESRRGLAKTPGRLCSVGIALQGPVLAGESLSAPGKDRTS